MWSYLYRFYIWVTQVIFLLTLPLTFILTVIALYGFFSGRRWLLLPKIIWEVLMLLGGCYVIFSGGSTKVCLVLLLLLLCFLLLVRFLLSRCLGNLIFSLSTGLLLLDLPWSSSPHWSRNELAPSPFLRWSSSSLSSLGLAAFIWGSVRRRSPFIRWSSLSSLK